MSKFKNLSKVIGVAEKEGAELSPKLAESLKKSAVDPKYISRKDLELLESVNSQPRQALIREHDPVQYKEYLEALDRVYGPKALRTEQVFGNPGKKVFHGTSHIDGPIKQFEAGGNGYYGKGVYTADNPTVASNYANPRPMFGERSPDGGAVYPLMISDDLINGLDYALPGSLKEHNALRPDRAFPQSLMQKDRPSQHEVLDVIEKTGLVDGINLPHKGYNVTPNPAKVRSVHAAFDPRFKDSKDILAGAAGVTGAGIAMAPTGKAEASEGKNMDEEARKKAIREMLKMQEPEPKVFADTGRKAESPADVLDAYITAPLRAGMAKASDVQVGEDTGFFSLKPTVEGFKAIHEQFGKDPRTAPTNTAVAEKMGMSSVPFSQTPVLKEMYRKKGEPVEMFDIRPEEGGMLDLSPANIVGGGIALGTDPVALTPFSKISKAFKGVDVLNPALHREASAKAFSKAVEKARAGRPDVVENVSQYTPEEYAKMRTFLSPDGKSGFALKPTDKGEELVNVFAAEKGLNRGDKIVSEAVNRGAQTLDAFDGYLPKLYEKHGFKPYKREPNFTQGGPDVVYMSQPKNPKLSADEITALREMELPPELRRQFPSQTPVLPDPEQIAAVNAAAKKAQYKRVSKMLEDRRKSRAKHADVDTDVIKKAD